MSYRHITKNTLTRTILNTKNNNEFRIIHLTFQTHTISLDVFIEHVCVKEDFFLSDYRFQPLPLAVAFILGIVFGCVINVFSILFCRNRYLNTYLYIKMRKANNILNVQS